MADVFGLSLEGSPEEGCRRCNTGVEEHTCWRRDVQLGTSGRAAMDLPILHMPMPLRAHRKHEHSSPGGVVRT